MTQRTDIKMTGSDKITSMSNCGDVLVQPDTL